MDETTKTKLPQPPVAIKWLCDGCKHWTQTPLDSARFFVPHCHNCRTKRNVRLVNEGIFMYEIDGKIELAQEIPRTRSREVINNTLWKRFCALLDHGQALMADGTPSKVYCRACEESPHGGPNTCPCYCHEAWAYRRLVEREARAA